jgi:hypothetical protein
MNKIDMPSKLNSCPCKLMFTGVNETTMKISKQMPQKKIVS